MIELKPSDRSTIERALGIIEGVACGVSESAANMLITAVEMIDCAMNGGADHEGVH